MAKILVVDDDLATNVAIAKALAGEGHVTRTAFTGEEAIQRFRTERFDLLITGLAMPKLDGVAMIGRLREQGALESVPFLLIGGASERETYRIARELGAADVVTRPIDPGAVQIRVRRVLERKKATSSFVKTPPQGYASSSGFAAATPPAGPPAGAHLSPAIPAPPPLVMTAEFETAGTAPPAASAPGRGGPYPLGPDTLAAIAPPPPPPSRMDEPFAPRASPALAPAPPVAGTLAPAPPVPGTLAPAPPPPAAAVAMAPGPPPSFAAAPPPDETTRRRAVLNAGVMAPSLAPPSADRPDCIGHLGNIEFAELVRLMFLGRKSGIIEVIHDEFRGEIALQMGEIVRASVSVEGREVHRSLMALKVVAGWKSGRFRLLFCDVQMGGTSLMKTTAAFLAQVFGNVR